MAGPIVTLPMRPTDTQMNLAATNDLLQTLGQAEGMRRQQQQQQAIFQEIAKGGSREQVAAALSNLIANPQFSSGLAGGLQRIGGAYAPPQTGRLTDIFVQDLLSRGQNPMKQNLMMSQIMANMARANQAPRGTIQTIEDPDNPGEFINAVVDPTTGQVTSTLGKPTQRQLYGGVPGEALTKTTQTAIEKDILANAQTIRGLERSLELFEPDFLTVQGKIRGKIEKVTDLFRSRDPDVQSFLGRQRTFITNAKREFLKFRKFITGVAGGIEEFKEIAKAFPDVENMSPTEFMAAGKEAIRSSKQIINLLDAIRSGGQEINKANVGAALKQVSLQDIPEMTPRGTTLQDLVLGQQAGPPAPQGMSLAEIDKQIAEKRRQLAELEKGQ